LPEQTTWEEKDILIEARKKLGLTQQQVADKSGVAMRHYQMFEGGTRKLTSSSFNTATKVLEALELDITSFARGGYSSGEANDKSDAGV
jgi:transcriptional regulator with XRE-family HTH domain